MRERVESAFASMIITSCALIVVGILGMMLGMGGGSMQLIRQHGVSGISAWMAVAGAVLLFGGLGLLTFTMVSAAAIGTSEKRGIRKVEPRAKVLARYATNRQGETAVLDWDLVDPDLRFYVRMELSDGNKAEFQCVREVFDQCGEGMRGEAQYQGRWLGAFRPYIGGQPPTS
ncbi:MAG: hypothetical protein QOJ65_164 [Fimbriimonadaceae bacterium]|jgi:hypothetical protein|nr:hypothetical protein [Fimbriimonadaceae bacterium]